MSSKSKIKTHWTWEEWQESREARRVVSLSIGPPVSRRRHSSSDRRLRAAFKGEHGPEFSA